MPSRTATASIAMATACSFANLWCFARWQTSCLANFVQLSEAGAAHRSPMRYLILSDIHANITAFDAVLAAAEGRWDKAVCLGDVVGYGPDPDAAVERLRSLNCVAIRGNHDKAIAGLDEAE